MNPPRDLRPPDDHVQISRRAVFRQAYEMYQDEETPEDLTGYTFTAEVYNQAGTKQLTLTETGGLSRPDSNTLVISLNTIQMGELLPGRYQILLLGTRYGETESFVNLYVTISQ